MNQLLCSVQVEASRPVVETGRARPPIIVAPDPVECSASVAAAHPTFLVRFATSETNISFLPKGFSDIPRIDKRLSPALGTVMKRILSTFFFNVVMRNAKGMPYPEVGDNR
jgi:hypothetical protein